MTALNQLRKLPVFFYTDNPVSAHGSGSAVRKFTNIRAYLDLGFQVQVIQFVSSDQGSVVRSDLPTPDCRLALVEASRRSARPFERLAFWLGLPRGSILNYLYPIRPAIVKEVRIRESRMPGAIHHFEYDQLASAAVAFPRLRSVWSNHDIESNRWPMLRQMRAEFQAADSTQRGGGARLRRLRQAEDWIAAGSRLILNIAEHERREFRENRHYQQAEILPMSLPDETPVPRTRVWGADGKLRMLHLGRIAGFVGYDSLCFLIEEVMPQLPQECLDRLEIWIVGDTNGEPYAGRIRSLAKPYPQMSFLGYIDDIRSIYGQVDLQIVGGHRASGLRTRIVESMAYGVPVLSTGAMAAGAEGLRPGTNILLADDGCSFARQIVGILANPTQLAHLASGARALYERRLSRAESSARLGELLERHL